MAEDILHSRFLELSSNNLDFDQNIFDPALFELNKEVESLSGKSIKDFVIILLLNFNLNEIINAEYIRETNNNHSRLLLPNKKNVYGIILSSININEGGKNRCSWRHG